jgi:hypothetical protein
MKNNLLFFFLISISICFSQKAPFISPFSSLATSDNLPMLKPIASTKSLGVTLWSNSFDNIADWIIDNNGQVGIAYGWNINSTNDSWYFATGISSTGGGNYAEISNGNPFPNPGTQATEVTYTLTTSSPINIAALGGTNHVSLEFEQYGARYNDLQEIQISTNGSTWESVGNNLDKPLLTASGGSAYPNPDLKKVNLSTVLPGNPTNVWIRFRWTTNLQNPVGNPNAWITYGWYIDNLKIVTNPTNDLTVISKYWGTPNPNSAWVFLWTYGLNYYQIPVTQTAPIDFEIKAYNAGINTQPNTSYDINVNSGVFTTSSANFNITSLDTVTLTASNQFTPPGIGNYEIVHSLSSDSIDDVPTNNSIANTNIAVTNYIYARDNGTPSGATSNGLDGFEAGNFFDVWSTQELKAIDVKLYNAQGGTVIGTEIFVKVYSIEQPGGNFILESESAPIAVTLADLNTEKTMYLTVPIVLQANTTYLAVVGSTGAGLSVVNAGTSKPQTSFIYDYIDQQWFYLSATPWVRLNFNPNTEIDEANATVPAIVYPNPTGDVLTIKMALNAANEAAVYIYDNLGALVKFEVFSGLCGVVTEQLAVSDLAAGLYTAKILTSDGLCSLKFSKK